MTKARKKHRNRHGGSAHGQSGGTGAGGGGKGHHGGSDFPFPNVSLPPLGTYDPGLYAQIQQSQRGLFDTQKDIRIANRQARADAKTSRQRSRLATNRSLRDLSLSKRHGMQDLRYQRHGTKINFKRDLTDLARARQRGEEDYSTALGNLTRKYTNLGINQAQAANARGVDEGGFSAASAEARARNQAFEKQPLDTEHARLQQDIATKQTRATKDFGRSMARYDILGHRIKKTFNLGTNRTEKDLANQLFDIHRGLHRTRLANRIRRSRAIREAGQYATDIAQQAYFQAHENNPHVKFPKVPSSGFIGGNITPHGRVIG